MLFTESTRTKTGHYRVSVIESQESLQTVEELNRTTIGSRNTKGKNRFNSSSRPRHLLNQSSDIVSAPVAAAKVHGKTLMVHKNVNSRSGGGKKPL